MLYYVYKWFVDSASGLIYENKNWRDDVFLMWMTTLWEDESEYFELFIGEVVIKDFGLTFGIADCDEYVIERKMLGDRTWITVNDTPIVTMSNLNDIRLQIAYRLGDVYILTYTSAAGMDYRLSFILGRNGKLQGYYCSIAGKRSGDVIDHSIYPDIDKSLYFRMKLCGYLLEG